MKCAIVPKNGMYLTSRDFEQWQDWFSDLLPAVACDTGKCDPSNLRVKNITFVVTERCNLACLYCYETHKSNKVMSWEVAKEAVDFILDEKRINGYYDFNTAKGVILEFIGGEPLLEIDLIDRIVEYFKFHTFELGHPWATNYMISLTTNGILYESPKVQRFLKRNPGRVSVGVTIDGNKELHDSCRVFPDGSGSYDIVEKAVRLWVQNEHRPQTKITLSPYNVRYLSEALKNVWSLGVIGAFTNFAFEEGWELEHARICYREMVKLADYLIDNDLYNQYYCSLFDETIGQPLLETRNWCFKAGTSILTPSGNVPIENLSIGDIVISGNGKHCKVTNVLKRSADNTATIRAAGMFKTNTTLEHPYLVKRFKYIGNKNVRMYADPEWIQVRDIKKGDKIALYYHRFGNVHVDEKLAYIVGRYIGDGWFSTTGYKLCCGYEKFEKLKIAMDEAGINYSISDYRTVKQFNIFKNNTALLNILSQIGHNAYDKNIPAEVFRWDRESVKNLLNGLFDSNGNYDKKRNLQRLSTINHKLANDVLILLRGLGYFPACYSYKKGSKSAIEGREVAIRDRYEICFNLDNQRSKSFEYDAKNNVIWSTVREVELNCEPYEVYNLTVEDDHTYIANGCIVHNCGGNGEMLAIGTDGRCFPCIRFMQYSLSTPGRQERPIGDIWRGLDRKEDNPWLCKLREIDMITQSPPKCLDCKIATGCSLCTGYNYDKFGDPNVRATFICEMHHARVMANVYYWNKLYQKLGLNTIFEDNVPLEIKHKIIEREG